MPTNNRRNENDNDKTKKYNVSNAKKRRKTNKKIKRSTDNDETKVVNTKRPVAKKQDKKKKKKKQHTKLKMFFKILLVLFLLLCVIGAGVVAAMFFGLFGDEFEITKSELEIGASNSVIVDANGGVIANLSGDEKRKIITLEEMADYLPKAYVAIEDERFYKHSGVDFKRTAGAIVHKVFGGSTYGGSTITQQLVKNITKDDETAGIAGIFRKVKEWAKAYQVERMISKDQILELYLNILFVGGEGNLHGVELGAEYYFNKSAKDLSLAECAFLAGINTSPSYYNPYKLASDDDTEEKRAERIKSKILTTLAKMKEVGFIENDEEYNQAVEEAKAGLKFEKAEIATAASSYSYHTDAILDQVISQVMEEKSISRELAENYVYSSGLTIYSTVDNAIQTRLEEEYAKEKYIRKGVDKKNGEYINDHTQSGMAVIDYKTGQVLGVAGGLGAKETSGWNRATQMKKQTGSSIKPIADVAPALEERVITPATVYLDAKTDFGGNYIPKNDDTYSNQLYNIRKFISVSKNIPAVKIMKELTPKKSLEYLEKLGLSSLDKNDEVLAIAIGGLTHGASPLEMAAAYGTIANDGVYITPTFYTKVVDSNGNTVLTPNQEQRRVFSEQTAYLTKSILGEPLKSGGTATYCAIPGMDTAAKTGTTDKSCDRWLCGFTPYYAAATWFGFDNNEEVRGFNPNPAGQIWSAVMKDIHKNLANATFTKPSGIVEETVCRQTGCLATAGCADTYVEIFSSNNIPEKCPGHGSQTLCAESGKVANEYCPTRRVNVYGVVPPKEQLNLWTTLSGQKSSGVKVEEVCDIHKKPEEEPKPVETPKENTATPTTTPSTNTTTTGGDSGKQSPTQNTTPAPSTNTSGGTETGEETGTGTGTP